MPPENAAAIEDESDGYISVMACSTCGGFIATLESRIPPKEWVLSDRGILARPIHSHALRAIQRRCTCGHQWCGTFPASAPEQVAPVLWCAPVDQPTSPT